MIIHNIISQSKNDLGFLEDVKYITNDRKTHYSLGLPQAQYNPAMYNRNGVSVFATLGNRESDNEQFMYLIRHNGNILEDVASWGTYPSGNYHSIASTLILTDGRILTAASSVHNESVSIKRSTNPYDLSSYSEIATLTFEDPAYFTMSLIGDTIYAVFRDQFERNFVTESTDFGETWSTPKNILELPTDKWAYPRNIYDENEIILITNVRNKTVTDVYDKAYLLRSTDGISFSNVNATFTKNIDVDGNFTEAELIANCEISTDIGFVSGGIKADDGTIWIFGANNGLYFWNGSTWQNKPITYTGYTNINATRLAMFNEIDNKYTLFVGATRDTNVYVTLKVTTTDSFDTYTIEEFKNPRAYNPVIAHNYKETKQTPLALLEYTSFGYGDLTEPFDSYSNVWLYI